MLAIVFTFVPSLGPSRLERSKCERMFSNSEEKNHEKKHKRNGKRRRNFYVAAMSLLLLLLPFVDTHYTSTMHRCDSLSLFYIYTTYCIDINISTTHTYPTQFVYCTITLTFYLFVAAFGLFFIVHTSIIQPQRSCFMCIEMHALKMMFFSFENCSDCSNTERKRICERQRTRKSVKILFKPELRCEPSSSSFGHTRKIFAACKKQDA